MGEEAIRTKLSDIKSRLNSIKSKATVKQKEKDLIPVYEVALELYVRGFKINNVDLNKSQATKFIIENNYLIPPFNAIDGMGEVAATSIVEARNKMPFTSKEDLINRTKVNKTLLIILESLNITDELEEDNQISLF